VSDEGGPAIPRNVQPVTETGLPAKEDRLLRRGHSAIASALGAELNLVRVSVHMPRGASDTFDALPAPVESYTWPSHFCSKVVYSVPGNVGLGEYGVVTVFCPPDHPCRTSREVGG
jgi:hypothetical protein